MIRTLLEFDNYDQYYCTGFIMLVLLNSFESYTAFCKKYFVSSTLKNLIKI